MDQAAAMEPPMHPKSDHDSTRQGLARKRAEQAYSPERLLQEEELDEGLLDSFPASDPVSISQPSTAMPAVSNRRTTTPAGTAGDAARRLASEKGNRRG